tara:strand:- start:9253 stop:10182 length:930 start_codon:yes stop_codon:yes gene_type:complete
MAVTLKIRRRASSGSAGSPSALKSGELAFNEVSATNTLFYGYGDDGSGNATSIEAIAGAGAYTTLSTAQTISGNKTFTGTVSLGSATLQGITTDVINEVNNLFYTDARARSAVSVTAGTGLSYNSSTGVFALGSIPNTSLANQGVTFTNGTTAFANNLGETVTIQGTNNEVEVGSSSANRTLTIGLPNDVTISNDLTVVGDLVVQGQTTTLSTTEVAVEDKNIVLGNTSSPSDTTADGGGITLKGSSDYEIKWVNSTNSWTFNQNINVTTGGLSIGGVQVINGSRVMSNTAITGSGNTIDNVEIDCGTF